MQNIIYKRFKLESETFSILLLLLQLYFVITEATKFYIVPFIISSFVYFLLSIIFYYSLSNKIILKNKSNLEVFGLKNELSEFEKLDYISKAISYVGSFKFCCIMVPSQIFIGEILHFHSSFSSILFTFFFLTLAFYMLCISYKNIIKANGYTDISMKQTFRYMMIYNNPNDNRGVVEKPFGVGSTLNLATKEGRMILWVILAIPITIISLLVIVFALSGKS